MLYREETNTLNRDSFQCGSGYVKEEILKEICPGLQRKKGISAQIDFKKKKKKGQKTPITQFQPENTLFSNKIEAEFLEF